MRQRLAGMALIVVASVMPVLAHHPFAAEYDWKKPATISGTVTKFDWGNPHAILVVKGTDEAGASADWTIELGSPGNLTRLGWNTQQLKAGDKVSVDGWLAKNGKRQLSAKSVRAPGGRELAAASSFFDEGRSTAVTDPGKQHEAVSHTVRP